MEQDVQQRFEALVDREGEHHLWTGAVSRSRRTGRVKVQGREMTAHRLAWILANGPLPPSVKVLPCPDVPACVLVDHLRVDRAVKAGKASRPTPRRGHGRRGGGSMQQRRPGVSSQSIDVYSYQLVEVSSSGTLTISSRDKNGNVVSNDTDSTVKCKKVLGP